jgi:hypothetical protein
MNFGYLLVVSKNESTDYLRMAYLLAMSIKHTQKPGFDKVALVTDDVESIKNLSSSWVFDHVIERDLEKNWDGRSWMDQLTPFEYTVCLDVDMLFFRDCSHWIEYFVENCELYISNKAYNYRGEIAEDDYYRKTFRENQLPNLYSFYTFFKKDSETVKEFFTLGRYIIKHPIEFSNQYLTRHKPKIVGTDEAFALSAKILGIDKEISYDLEFPKVLHMKPMVQGWPWESNKVTDHVGFYLNRKYQLKVGNFQQFDLVHYVEKDKADLEMVSILEKMIWKK